MTSLEQISKGLKDYKDKSLTDEEKEREEIETKGYVFKKPIRSLIKIEPKVSIKINAKN